MQVCTNIGATASKENPTTSLKTCGREEIKRTTPGDMGGYGTVDGICLLISNVFAFKNGIQFSVDVAKQYLSPDCVF